MGNLILQAIDAINNSERFVFREYTELENIQIAHALMGEVLRLSKGKTFSTKEMANLYKKCLESVHFVGRAI